MSLTELLFSYTAQIRLPEPLLSRQTNPSILLAGLCIPLLCPMLLLSPMPPASSLPAALGAHQKSLASQFLTQFLGIHGQWQAHGDRANGDLGMLGAVGCVELDGHTLWSERRGQGAAAGPCEASPAAHTRYCTWEMDPMGLSSTEGCLVEEMRGGGLEMPANLCSPERELSCRFSGMGCPVWKTRALARQREGRVAATTGEKRAKGGSRGWMW